jgi:integrase
MKGLIQNKDGKYYLVFYFNDSAGKRKQKWVGTGLSVKGNKTKAQKMLDDYLADDEFVKKIENQADAAYRDDTDVNIGAKTKFADYLDKWLEIRKAYISSGTYQGYKVTVGLIRKFFDKKNILLTDLNPLHIESYYQHMRGRGNSPNTVLHHHVIIRKALDYAVKTDLISNNPADKIERPKIGGKYIANFCNRDEIEKIFEAYAGHRHEIIVYLAAYYGLRRSEVLGLRWSSVDFKNKKIVINHKVEELFGKFRNGGAAIQKSDILKNTSSYRALPLFPKIEELLLNVKEKIAQDRERLGDLYCDKNLDYICLDYCGQIVKPSTLTQTFPQTLVKNGLKKIRFHDLRHSCASLMLAEGVPMKQIQEWLGHSTFLTTADTYSHLDYNSKIASANKIGKALDFSGGMEADDDDDSIQKFMREHGLRDSSELMDFIEKYNKDKANKQRKNGYEM